MRATPDNEFISLVATIPLDNAFFNELYKIHLKIAVVLHSNLIVDCTLIVVAIGISIGSLGGFKPVRFRIEASRSFILLPFPFFFF